MSQNCASWQANFIVPSSREAVESDSAWNQELRSHLPQLFLQALDAFKAQPDTEHLTWVNHWLHCIPLPGEVIRLLSLLTLTPALQTTPCLKPRICYLQSAGAKALECLVCMSCVLHDRCHQVTVSAEGHCVQAEDFFSPLPQAIISCLRGAPCIATESNTWVLPAEAVISHQDTDAARGLLAHAISFGIPSANYVHPALTALHTNNSLRSALGIKLLDTDHLLSLLQTAALQGMLPSLGSHWVASMLACIFDMLASKEPHMRSLKAQDITLSTAAQDLLQQLKMLPMLLTSTGKWVAAGAPLF